MEGQGLVTLGQQLPDLWPCDGHWLRREAEGGAGRGGAQGREGAGTGRALHPVLAWQFVSEISFS